MNYKLFFVLSIITSCNGFMSMNNFSRRNFCGSIAGASLINMTMKPVICKAEPIETISVVTVPINNGEDEDGYIIKAENNIIRFYGDISVNSLIELRESLEQAVINSLSVGLVYGIEPPAIKLYIQSNGGSVMPTFAIVDWIKNSKIPIHSYIDGPIASSATLISVSCHKRFMTKNSFTLIHQLSSGFSGKYMDMEENMVNLGSFMKAIKNIYIDNTKIKENNIDEILSHDIWWDSAKCLEMGLIDEIVG